MRILSSAALLSLAFPLSVLAADESKLLSVDASRDHIRGDAKSTASMVVYSDFECPFCRRFHPTVEKIREKYPRLRIVYRNFPLSFHKLALPAAKAAECVAREKGNASYWTFVDSLMTNEMTAASIRNLALKQDISESVYDACIADSTIQEKITGDIQGGVLAGVNGTPASFLINEDGVAFKIAGAVPFETIDKRLSTFTFSDKSAYSEAKIKTTKRTARVRATVPGLRRWKK